MVTSQADLKEALRLSLFYTTTENRLNAAKSKSELAEIAKAMDTPEFFALENAQAEELAYLFSVRHFTLDGAGAA